MPDGGLDMEAHDKMQISLRLYDGIRGSWIGFNRGLYKNAPGSSMEKTCMAESIKSNWEEAYSVWLGTDDLDDNIDMITAFGDILLVIANLTSCELRDPYRDLRNFCRTPMVSDPALTPEDDEYGDLKEGKSQCAFGPILGNLSKNAFALMGKTGSIAELYKEYPAKNPDELMVQSLTLGDDVGSVLRMGLDFVSP